MEDSAERRNAPFGARIVPASRGCRQPFEARCIARRTALPRTEPAAHKAFAKLKEHQRSASAGMARCSDCARTPAHGKQRGDQRPEQGTEYSQAHRRGVNKPGGVAPAAEIERQIAGEKNGDGKPECRNDERDCGYQPERRAGNAEQDSDTGHGRRAERKEDIAKRQSSGKHCLKIARARYEAPYRERGYRHQHCNDHLFHIATNGCCAALRLNQASCVTPEFGGASAATFARAQAMDRRLLE